MCPDFAAEHADISTGGIGEDNDWTLTIVRTDLGREIISRMISLGRHHLPPGRHRREGHEAAAHAVDRQPPPVAVVGRQRGEGRRAAAQEEGRSGRRSLGRRRRTGDAGRRRTPRRLASVRPRA